MKKILTSLTLVFAILGASEAFAGGKCGSGMTNMSGDFQTVKTAMLQHIDQMKECILSSNTKQDIMECKNTISKKKVAKCGAGKCGGGKK